MKRVTRNIDPDRAWDLLERVPRACLCYTSDHGPQAKPITLIYRDGRYLVGIPRDAGAQPGSEQEVVLLVDEGVRFFDLRAIYMRGRLTPAEAPPGAPAELAWFELLPFKTVAWDYGMLREVEDED